MYSGNWEHFNHFNFNYQESIVGRQNKYIFFTKDIVTGSSEFRVAMYLKYFLYSFPNKIKEKSTQEMFLSAHAWVL